MKVALFIIFSALISMSSSMAKIFVLEFQYEGQSELHGELVQSVACRNTKEDCPVLRVKDFNSKSFKNSIDNLIDGSDVVNMSFALTKPKQIMGPPNMHAILKESIKEYEDTKQSLKEMIDNNPNILFSAAAGNGDIGFYVKPNGIAVVDKTEFFPTRFEHENLITVAALEDKVVDKSTMNNVKLADYSNYGLEHVDVAAPTGPNRDGEFHNGTSFAAPYVSDVANKLKIIDSSLSPEELKEILMKSCYVKNIDKAIDATRSLIVEGRKSKVYKAMTHRKKEKRDLLLNELGDILLVKCGGTVVSDLALRCAENLKEDKSNSISESCLMAHQSVLNASASQLEKLEELWSIRNI